MPRGRYVNHLRHAVTLPHGQPVAPGEGFEADHSPELQNLLDSGAVGHLAWVEPEQEPAGGIASEEALGQASVQVGPPPAAAAEEQPADPDPAADPGEQRAAALEERHETSAARSRPRRSSSRKEGDRG